MNRSENEYEEDNLSGQNNEAQNANVPVRRLTATSIIGDSVENPDGEDLGKIENLMINLESGTIEYVVLEFGTVLGLGGKLFAIPFAELALDPLREKFILNQDKEYLKNAPGIDKDHWPGTNNHPEYYTTVSDYWATPPIAAPAPGSPLSAYY